MGPPPVVFVDVGLYIRFLYSYFMGSQELEGIDVFNLFEWKLESEFLTVPNVLDMPQVWRVFLNHWQCRRPG